MKSSERLARSTHSAIVKSLLKPKFQPWLASDQQWKMEVLVDWLLFLYKKAWLLAGGNFDLVSWLQIPLQRQITYK